MLQGNRGVVGTRYAASIVLDLNKIESLVLEADICMAEKPSQLVL